MSEPRIASLTLDPVRLSRPRSPEVEHELNTALHDLRAENQCVIAEIPGPYEVFLKEEEGRLVFDINEGMHKVSLSLQPLKGLIRDYFLICESYYSAIKSHDSRKLEAIDMGRRGLHNEGAERLQEMLTGKITLDFCTARRLFTLICVLHMK